MSTQPVQRLTPLQLLRLREESWERRLMPTRLSLVAEDVKTSSKHTEQALKWLGGLWYKQSCDPALLRRFPAVHVLTTTRVATDHYAASFWPQFFKLAGIPNEQGMQHAWGTAYINNLRQLELPTFDDIEDRGSRFVGPILMHSGVPTYCLPDLLRLARDRRRLTPGLTPEAFVGWAGERARHDRLQMVDKPVQRFLRYGGEFAVDVLDRVFELLDVIAAGGNGEGVELPSRFHDAALEMRSAGESLHSRSYSAGGETPFIQPRSAALMLDPLERGPFVRLPSIPDADEGQVVWIVGADAHEERVASRALLPGYREPTAHVDVPVNRPVRQVSARLEGSSQLDLTVPVVDGERPLLVFDEDGMQLSSSAPLRRGSVWVLSPDTHPIQSPGPDKYLTQAALPPGWDGWSLRLLDLEGVTELRLEDGTSLSVQARAVPRIVMPAPVPGAATLSGEVVFARLPEIELPEFGDDGPTWSLSLLDHLDRTLLRKDIASSDDAQDAWSELTETLCGEVSLRIRGPWGRNAGRRFTVVQDLDVVTRPAWRRMTGSGLVDATVELSAARAIRCSTTVLKLRPSQVKEVVSVSAGPERLPLVIEPPHMSVFHITPAKTGQPAVTAVRLQTEALLDDPGVLIVGTGSDVAPTLYAFSREGVLQSLAAESSAMRSTTYRFPLGALTDTLRAEQQLRLCLDPDGELTVALIRPGRLFSGIEVEDEELILDGAPDIDGLTAICFSALAPWREPTALAVSGGRAMLPAQLVDVGPLLVHVRIDDPWLPEPIPTWPQGHRSADQPGHLTEGSADEIALSRYLAGEQDLVDGCGDLSIVWTTYDRLWQLGLGPRATDIDARLRSLLTENVRESLVALSQTTIEVERMPLALIRSGIIGRPVEPGDTQLPTVRRTNVLAVACLSGLGEEHILDGAAAVCGDVIRDLASGLDPIAQVGGFDGSADLLARMTSSQRRSIYRTAGIVPAGLLDKDSRVLASEALLANRKTPRLDWLRRNVARQNEDLRRALHILGSRSGLAAMEARSHPSRPYGWRAIPEWSIGVAFACRLTAHKGTAMPILQSWLRSLEDLAHVAPELVTIDLLIADLLVRADNASKDQV